ncbi:hypothetical protein KTE28_06970 [Burkholderia multivorans]|uniref:hypothetical protein n=1 Tax=Burkholderia multivorans TaxID=87883 RepID=UPI001C279CFD|nr:hypothetical protein [Burkholderia multivorans]MBU9374069.1 hypothetical protein [Burkholderia multivorans]
MSDLLVECGNGIVAATRSSKVRARIARGRCAARINKEADRDGAAAGELAMHGRAIFAMPLARPFTPVAIRYTRWTFLQRAARAYVRARLSRLSLLSLLSLLSRLSPLSRYATARRA